MEKVLRVPVPHVVKELLSEFVCVFSSGPTNEWSRDVEAYRGVDHVPVPVQE